MSTAAPATTETVTAAPDAAVTSAKKTVKDEQEAREKQIEQSNKRMGRPTPTQEENDLVALGVPILTHSDDGSGSDPRITRPIGGPMTTRDMGAERPAAGYQTRSAHAGGHPGTSAARAKPE